ncbi:allophanate hydrolase [Rhizobium grahamii]|uniref:Allophanate hydrolase n=1 Tax=Rhizobium grahamii TaxID=1120045 RepID=A0A370KHL9_9HYPH|nr:allophanate hydrolase [Rhizobium grahamii]RDJ04802.1 allophanate hydrolase [Rhizobium grahamii]
MTAPAFDISSLHAFYRNGGRAEDVIQAVFDRLADVNDPGIFISTADKSDLLAKAAGLGAFDVSAKPLWGIPFAVKDNIDVVGMPTTAACPDYAYTPDKDATVVARLKEAGAIVIGKTNLDQFATGLVGVRSPYPIPRNAIDPKLVPGGSSSGSAVATAQGIVSFALGTDTAGSGRVPAGLNNIVGLKPSLGALSTTGVIPACRTLDCVSVFALTVDDAWLVFSAAAGPDETDAYSRDFGRPELAALPPALKVGVPARADLRFFGDQAMAEAYDHTLDELASMGHAIKELPFADFYKVADLLYEGAWVAERYAAVKEFFDTKEASFHPLTRKIYGSAKMLSATDAFRGLYTLQAYRKQLAPILASVDLLCVPTAPRHFTVAELEAEPIRENSRLGSYTNFVNLLDMCGIAVPCGMRRDGLPSSVTLLACAGKDGLTAALARKLQQKNAIPLGATNWRLPKPAPLSIATQEQLIDLVVVGAHLSGMGLNHQLTSRNARFLRNGKTSSAYRLYDLQGQLPSKPGLIRTGNMRGGEIDVEIWQLSPAAFGSFVAEIPAPLGIGTIELSDGSSAKGFLVEAAAIETALDITSFGGWRHYLNSQNAVAREPLET